MTIGYLIDVAAQQVRAVDYVSLDDMRTLIGGWLSCAGRWPTGDVLYVDDEGLLKSAVGFFRLDALRLDEMPLAGNGLVVGREHVDAQGRFLGNMPPRVTLAEVEASVRFVSREQAAAWGRANASEPASVGYTLGGNGALEPEVFARFGGLYARATRDPEGGP